MSGVKDLQNALVLHSRPYRNTSLLVDFFCEKEGLLRCVAKGFKSKKTSLLSPFCVYDISFIGRNDLKTLTQCDPVSAAFYLRKQALYCGLYVNELLLRVLYPFAPHPELFKLTCDLFEQLSQGSSQREMEYYLRFYEFALLKDIGYLVDLNHDYVTGESINQQNVYFFDQEHGFSKAHNTETSELRHSISGETIHILRNHNQLEFSDSFDESFYKEAKTLSRLMLSPYLGDKPLRSRDLFQKLQGHKE